MATVISIAMAAAGLALLYLLYRSAGRAYFKSRGVRVVTCPENTQPAAVTLDALHAATSTLRSAHELHLQNCSRWPERKDCGQSCLQQIETSPDGYLVRSILTSWYHDKTCAICGKPVGEIHWADHKPAILSPDRRTLEWHEVKPEDIPATLASHLPVCWNCHIVQTFRRDHPELVIDRSRPA